MLIFIISSTGLNLKTVSCNLYGAKSNEKNVISTILEIVKRRIAKLVELSKKFFCNSLKNAQCAIIIRRFDHVQSE
jgi:hypothetical protein